MNSLKRSIVVLIVCVVALVACQASSAWANMYLITATLNSYGVSMGYGSGFNVLYNDSDADSPVPLLGNEDISSSYQPIGGSFSGVKINGYLYPDLESVPYNSTASPYTDGAYWVWTFYDPNPPIQNGYGCDPAGWTYNQSRVSEIPVPSAALLLGSGLIPLAWLRRKKRMEK